MPKVGNKHFSYDEAGNQKAMQESQRTGLPVEHEDKNYAQFAGGGSVKGQGYGKARMPALKGEVSKAKKSLKGISSKTKKSLKETGKTLEKNLRRDLKKAFGTTKGKK